MAGTQRCLLILALLALADGSCPKHNADGTESTCYKNRWRVVLHACFMGIGWGLLLPWGAAVAMYRRFIGKAGGGAHHKPTIFKSSASFYPLHRNLQVLGVVFVLAGFFTIYTGLPKVWGVDPKKYEHFGHVIDCTPDKKTGGMWADLVFCHNPHTVLGVWIVGLMGIQVVLGVAHHILLARFNKMKAASGGKAWARPVFPSYLHVYLGWTLVVLALLNCAMGCDLFASIYPYESGPAARHRGVPLLLTLLVLYVLVNVYEQAKLWRWAGHCIPFRDGQNALQCCPPAPADPATGETPAPEMEMGGRGDNL